MLKRRLFWLLIAVGVLVALIVVGAFREREPSYGGRSLSEWVLQYCAGGLGVDARKAQAADAIRHIGTNAIPYFLAWEQYRMPPWRVRLAEAVDKLPHSVKFDWMMANRKLLLVGSTPEAFAILGPDARAAIPGLTRMMNDPRADWYTACATYSLAQLGPEALPPLLMALTNGQSATRRDVVLSMASLGTNARPALPFIIERLQDKDEQLAVFAARTLAQLKLENALVVSALTVCLSDPRPRIKQAAAAALQEFGADARLAVPDLLRMLEATNSVSRNIATNALRIIDPQALGNAGNR